MTNPTTARSDSQQNAAAEPNEVDVAALAVDLRELQERRLAEKIMFNVEAELKKKYFLWGVFFAVSGVVAGGLLIDKTATEIRYQLDKPLQDSKVQLLIVDAFQKQAQGELDATRLRNKEIEDELKGIEEKTKKLQEVVDTYEIRLNEVTTEQSVDNLLNKIEALDDKKAIDLAKDPPVQDGEADKVVKLRDPGNSAKSDPKVAREMLRMRVILGKRELPDLNKWEKVVGKTR